mgnify:CR=1 FL=1
MEAVRCNLCGSGDATLLFGARDINYKITREEFSVVRCLVCGLVYLNPRPEESKLYQFYPDAYRPYHDKRTTIYRSSRELIESIYLEPEHPSKYVLDIGSGGGDFLAEIHKKDPTLALYGVDFDRRAVEAGREKGFPIFCGSLEKANYPAEKFDEAHMSHFLEHVPDPLEALKETARILKPDGVLIITIPNFRSISRMIFGKYWYHLDAPRHLYHFTPRTLTAMLRKAGFRNIYIEFIPSPKYFLQSYAFWKYGGKKSFPKLIWRVLVLPSYSTSMLHLSSTMRATTRK